MKARLAVLGGGGHGRVVADCALAAGWGAAHIFDDDASRTTTGPWPISGNVADLMAACTDFDGVVVGIGGNAVRLSLTRQLQTRGATLATLIHPAATVSPHATVGAGSVVFAGAVVNIGARLGRAVIINTGATVDHDCVLEDGVHVSPGAHLAGGVTVGRESWVGIGSAVREGVTIGHQVCVGAGAVVVKSIADGLTVVGNPARPLER